MKSFLIIISILGWLGFFGMFWLTVMISKLYITQKQQTYMVAEHAEFLSRYLDWEKVPAPYAE
jgi:hypothetical protein